MKLTKGAMTAAILGPLLMLTAEAQPFSANPVEALSAQACRSLATIALPELAAIDTEWVDAEAPSVTAAGEQTAPLPAFCRVRGVVEPAVRFEVWMPLFINWNNRFLGLGGTSLAGSVDYARLRAALAQGYATAMTDSGHTLGNYAWLSDAGRLRDFGYRAIFEMTAKAQYIVATYFGRAADFRYFNGCSLGGRQGLMEAQRFAEDYDGIIAGAPVLSEAETRAAELWSAQVAQSFVAGANAVGKDVARLVNDAAIAQCDTLDGVLDGVLEDPRRCNFDPARLQCGIGRTVGCLTPTEVAGVRQIYDGLPRDPTGNETGRRPGSPTGFAVGSELDWSFVSTQGPSAPTLEFFYRAVYADSTRSWRDFDVSEALTLAEDRVGWMLDATSPDLADFRDRGGKLILYQGWSDAVQPPEATIAYYEAVEAMQPMQAGAGVRPTWDFARLFMVPGMAHCAGGTGTDNFDMQRAIEDWVERGIGPDRIEASRIEADEISRTRPLCPYPQVARYRGNGNSDRSGSFVCDF